jgi:flagellar basal-body rod modification protein FlgD
MISSTSPTTSNSGSAGVGTTSTQSATPGGDMGKDQFLKLLIAQLQNQDPMNPLQGDQMASELAQFSSLEQLQEINTTLGSQGSTSGALLGAIQATAAINTIGHTVTALGNQVQIGGDSGSSTVSATVSSAGTGTLHIYNSAGVEVGSRSLGLVSSGKQDFTIGDAAKNLPAGTYTFSVDVQDSAGNSIPVQTYMTGKVDGVSSGQNGIILTAGGMQIAYGDIVQIN